jgi:serine phosphatase RsbU (regulator of sigma subunit)
VAAHGTALGVVPGLERWPTTTLPLPAQGALVAYTDGLIEGYTGEANDRLGTEGLLRIMNKMHIPDPGAHLDRLIAETRTLNAGQHTDDLAVLRLDWNLGPASG